MGENKVSNLASSGADVVTLCDVSCMTHINGLLERDGHHCRAVHIAQVLNNEVDVAGSADGQQTDQSSDPPRRWQDARSKA